MSIFSYNTALITIFLVSLVLKNSRDQKICFALCDGKFNKYLAKTVKN